MKNINLIIESVGTCFDNYSNFTRKGVSFNMKDKRYDPIVSASLCALEKAVKKYKSSFNIYTPIIGITNTGCRNYIKRISSGIEKNQPRPAFFVRAGAQTIATYASMALGIHGMSIVLSGKTININHIFNLLSELLNRDNINKVILISADYIDDKIISSVFIFSKSNLQNKFLSQCNNLEDNIILSLYKIAKEYNERCTNEQI